MSKHPLKFELDVFSESEAVAALLNDVSPIRRSLFVAGVPKGFIGRRYAADSTATVLARGGSEPLVRFGSSGLADAVCVDITTGHVIEIINAPGSERLFVNTSIDQFTRTVKAVIARFPYYGQDAAADEIGRVADELLDIIRNIDPEAAVPDRYWSTFVDDVRIGDLSSEAILAIGK